MTNEPLDLRHTIIPKSDQLNSDQLLAGPMTITVTEVRLTNSEEQPVIIHYEGENGRPYKPCKTMRKVLLFAWGSDGSQWPGRSMTLYNRPDVKFGGQEVGGIRISHLSHIDSDIKLALTSTRGRKDDTKIKRLVVDDRLAPIRAGLKEAARNGTDALRSAWGKVPPAQRKAIDPIGCPDELKRIAAEADRKSTTPVDDTPTETLESVLSAIKAAQSTDEADEAYDRINLVPNATPEDRQAAAEAWSKRHGELQ